MNKHKIFFITGASGAGKTTALKKIQENNADKFSFNYFDSVGVPSSEEMVRDFGSGESWQRATTVKWVETMLTNQTDEPSVLDGQIRPSFIDEACEKHNFTNFKVVLFDCSDEARKQRLVTRGHPELANDDMMNWAKYLREEAQKRGYVIIDNTEMTEEETRDELIKILNE